MEIGIIAGIHKKYSDHRFITTRFCFYCFILLYRRSTYLSLYRLPG